MSIVDAHTFHEVQRVHLGAYPRGIAIDRSSRVAYVAVMGSYDIARVDLGSFGVSWFRGVGNAPRHLVLSADGTRLFVTLNGSNRIVAVNTTTGNIVASVSTSAIKLNLKKLRVSFSP